MSESSSEESLIKDALKFLDSLEELIEKYRGDSWNDDEDGSKDIAHTAYLTWDALNDVSYYPNVKAYKNRDETLKDISDFLITNIPDPDGLDDL